ANDCVFSNSSKCNFLPADPPSPTLTPSTLEVTEGTSVRLKCSAPAPCLSQPPTLTWTPRLGDSQETLQENQDKTKVVTSVLTFTASHLHHGKTISCAATYNKQDGTKSTANTSLTADISFAPQILSTSGCTKTEAELNCFCETVGNPTPILQWHSDELNLNQSDKYEDLNDTTLRSFITVSQVFERDAFTFLCHSTNSLGSVTQWFYVFSLVREESAGSSFCRTQVSLISCKLSGFHGIQMNMIWKCYILYIYTIFIFTVSVFKCFLPCKLPTV
uniref:Ig-like domain-containing protein n=1 Tax=Seriola dumerili TaxID=41447 RepID=A0A3B4U9P2_SERDU